MKLKDWADKQGISYLTAWRWFKAGDPRLANAYQSDSGTIIVPDDNDPSETQMAGNTHNDVMSTVLKKTVELSKNNASIEDFAAWILSNYSLKPNTHFDGPRYSRNKPKSEEVQKHFQQFLKPKGEKPKPNMFVAQPDDLDNLMAKADDLTVQELAEEINKVGVEVGVPLSPTETPEVEDLMKDLSSTISAPNTGSLTVMTYDNIAGGVVARSVDLTPQQFNYTGSTNPAPSSFSLSASDAALGGTFATNSVCLNASVGGAAIPAIYAASFQPTQKELETVAKVSEIAEKPKRGRKPSKHLGRK
jgi:hypothetical protein